MPHETGWGVCQPCKQVPDRRKSASSLTGHVACFVSPGDCVRRGLAAGSSHATAGPPAQTKPSTRRRSGDTHAIRADFLRSTPFASLPRAGHLRESSLVVKALVRMCVVRTQASITVNSKGAHSLLTRRWLDSKAALNCYQDDD